jgi:hypothetical protein
MLRFQVRASDPAPLATDGWTTGRRDGIGASKAYDPFVDRASPTFVLSAAEVAGALVPYTAELSADIYQLIVREIPQLHTDGRVLALLEASVAENVATVLHILQHGIDLDRVHAPAAAEQYARRLAQHGIPMAALLRAYRIGSTRFQHWCLQELARQTDDPRSSAPPGCASPKPPPPTSTKCRKSWSPPTRPRRRTGSATSARPGSPRPDPAGGDGGDVDASEAILGYRLRQYHVGVVCWLSDPEPGGRALVRLEQATTEQARRPRVDSGTGPSASRT